MPQFRTPQGAIVTIPEDQASGAIASGYEPVSVEQAGAVTSVVTPEDRGVLGGINAAATGLLSGATLGLSDYAIKGLLNQGEFERLASEREAHPIASGAGQVIGAIAPALLAPGSSFARALPSGALSSAVAPIAARGAAGVLAAGAVEGAFQNAGAYLADTALGDRELSAEGVFGALGAGGAFGVAGGAAALGIERGTMAARRMFSRAGGTEKAALEAEEAWKAAHQSTIEANDAAADLAKAKLAEARAAREEAQLAKQKAKLRVATAQDEMAANPEIGLPAPSPDEAIAGMMADRARAAVSPEVMTQWDAVNGPRLQAALEERGHLAGQQIRPATGVYQRTPEELRMLQEASRAEQVAAGLSPAAEADLAQAVAEHDAARIDLDDLLRRIEAPSIEAGIHPPAYEVPIGEFGAPGMRGYDPGNVRPPGPPSIAEGPLGQGTPVQSTVVGKKLGHGTDPNATTAFDSKDLGLAFESKRRVYHNPDMPWRKAEKFAPSEPTTGMFERPSGLEDIVRMQKEAALTPDTAAVKPPAIEEMTREQIDAFQKELDRKFGSVQSGSREYVELSRQWDEAVARKNELVSGKATARVKSDTSSAAPLSEDEFDAFSKSWQPSLTPETVKAMQAYTANGAYAHVNGPLRLGEGIEGVRIAELKEAIPLLDSAIAQAPAPRDMVVHRGVSGRRSTKEWNDVGPGDVIVDRAYGSTSSMPHVGQSYSKGMNARPGAELRISVPKGYPAAPVPSEIFGAERELLLPRNTKYTVDKVVTHDEGRVIFVTASPAAEGEASIVGAASRRNAKSLDALSLSELEDRMEALSSTRKRLERTAQGRASEEFKTARSDYELAYQRQQEIKSGKVPEPKPELPILDVPPAPPAPAGDDLLAPLRGTESKLGAGSELGALSKESPAAAEYVANKAAKSEADAAHFRTKAVERNYEGSAMAAAEREAQDAARGEFFAGMTRPKTRDAYVAANIGRAMREEGSHAAALAKVEREWAEMGGAPPARTVADDVAAAAEIITKYERSAAKVTEALGADAPPAAQEAAKAFRKAEETAERKTMDRTTRAIDDGAGELHGGADVLSRIDARVAKALKKNVGGVDSQGRPRGVVQQVKTYESQSPEAWMAAHPNEAAASAPPPPSPVQVAKSDLKAADMTLQRAKVSEAEARIGSRKADEIAAQTRATAEAAHPPPPAPPEQSTLGSLATAIGIAGEVGVPGVPHPKDIPIIGPLLSLYLKYKALKYATGRFVGRVGATGDTRAAALVAKTKDKIATAVDKTLGLVETGARKGRPALTAATVVLGHRAFDDGEPDAPKGASAQELAAVRIREIATAASRPDLVSAYVRKEMRGVVDPDLLDAAEKHLIARFEYLNRVMPKAPPPNPYSMRKWVPSQAAASEVAQRLGVVHDPASAFVDTTPIKADTLKNTSPRLLQLAQERLTERLADAKHPVEYNNRLRGSLLFSVPLDDSMRPEHAAILATAHAPSPITDAAAPQAGPPQASIAAGTNLSSVYRTGTERRAL